MLDPASGLSVDALSLDARSELELLRNELDHAGLMKPYQQSDGGYAR